MWITGHCTSNQDELNSTRWPSIFTEGIQKGDRVQSLDGKISAYVSSITHTAKKAGTVRRKGWSDSTDMVPYVIVEINQRR